MPSPSMRKPDKRKRHRMWRKQCCPDDCTATHGQGADLKGSRANCRLQTRRHHEHIAIGHPSSGTLAIMIVSSRLASVLTDLNPVVNHLVRSHWVRKNRP
jgi:hypothetical protein